MATQQQGVSTESEGVVVRRATPRDAEVCGRICFDAFATLAKKHNFPPDFPDPERPTHVLSMMFSHPSFFCVVAEQNGKVVGSNCLDERTSIAGLGPITIDPDVQNRTVGRQLMHAVMGVRRRGSSQGYVSFRRLTTTARSLFMQNSAL